jgi:hypothetical protein
MCNREKHMPSMGKVIFAPELQCSCHLRKLRKHLFKLSKNLNIILSIVNDTSHNNAKSQPKILLFMEKLRNLICFGDLKMYDSDLHFCYFCVAKNT